MDNHTKGVWLITQRDTMDDFLRIAICNLNKKKFGPSIRSCDLLPCKKIKMKAIPKFAREDGEPTMLQHQHTHSPATIIIKNKNKNKL